MDKKAEQAVRVRIATRGVEARAALAALRLALQDARYMYPEVSQSIDSLTTEMENLRRPCNDSGRRRIHGADSFHGGDVKQATPRLRARSRALTPARRLLEETLLCLRTLTTTWDEQDLEHDFFARRVTKLVHETKRFLDQTDPLSNKKGRA